MNRVARAVVWVGGWAAAGLLNAAEPGRWAPSGAESGQETLATGAVGLQLALWTPVQVFSEKYDVAGLHLALPYGKNAGLYGLSVGGFGWMTGEAYGAQIGVIGTRCKSLAGVQVGGLWNLVDGDMVGVQLGLYNDAGPSGGGFQLGLVNRSTENLSGFQLGVFNWCRDMHGLQIGIANVAESMEGVQIGLFNYIRLSPFISFAPIVNAYF